MSADCLDGPQVRNLRSLPGRSKTIPAGGARVDRATVWGNPFVVGTDGDRLDVITRYAEYLEQTPVLLERIGELRGLDLWCWCAPQPCHADVLLELANEETTR